MSIKVITKIPKHGDSRFKQWARDITGVNHEESNAYAFEFDQWLSMGRKEQLEVGSYILLYGEEGSRKYHDPHVKVCRVNQDGSLETVIEEEKNPDWVLDIRDEVAELLEKDPDLDSPFDPTLIEDYDDDEEEVIAVDAFGHRYLIKQVEDKMMGGTSNWVRAETTQAHAKLAGCKSTDPQDPTYGGGEERVMKLLHWIEEQIGGDRTIYAGILPRRWEV